MSESNNNIPMRITQLQEKTAYEKGMYLPVAKAGSGTFKILSEKPSRQDTNLYNQIRNIENIYSNNAFELGNISLTGEDTTSTINFRTIGFISPLTTKIQAFSGYRFGVARYTIEGDFVDRTLSLDALDYDQLDFSNYKYRVTARRTDNGTVSSSDFYGIMYESKFIDFYNANKAALDGFTIEFEQGNIASNNGALFASDYNIRTKTPIPNFIKKIVADVGFKISIARYNISTGAFVDRSGYDYSEFSNFDFSTYFYKVLLNKPDRNSAKLTPETDSVHVHFFDKMGELTFKINAIQSECLLLDDYLNKNGVDNIITSVRGAKTMDNMIANDITSIKDEGYKTHDATICIYDDIIFVVRANYITSDNAAADDCQVVLTSCDLDGSNKSTVTLAKKGDTFGDYSMSGGCGSPNLYLEDDKIHIFFTAKTNGSLFAIFHGVYDITNGTFGDVSPIKIDNNICNSEYMNYLFSDSILTKTTFNGMQINARIATDGTNYFVGLCKGTTASDGRGCILKSTDFVNWTVYSMINPERIHPVYEIACAYKNNYLYVMCRASYGNYRGYLAKYSNGSLVEECYLLDGSSRPDFFEFENGLFLIVTNDYTRRNIEIIEINPSNLLLSHRYIQDHNSLYQYIRTFVYDNIIYSVRTSSESIGIVVSKINLNIVNDQTIRTQLLTLFE